MLSVLLYLGPGLGAGTIIIVFVVLAVVVLALGLIVWIPIKNFFKKVFGKK